MYVPSQYNADDKWATTIARRYPLAVLISNGTQVPHATHLPVIPEDAANDSLRGSTMLGHMNKMNPHWAALLSAGTTPVKMIFHGPHSYVTPTIYSRNPAAPTWNFVTVHVEGVLVPRTGLEETLEVVRRTAEVFENNFGDRWCPATSEEYFRDIVSGVGAFSITVEHVQAMFKLSQEKSPEVRERLRAQLALGESGTGRDLAWIMGEFLSPPIS